MKALRWFWWASLIAAIATFSAPAQATTLGFDLTEISAETPQVANGISVAGVTFGFEVGGSPSTDAGYGEDGPGALTYIDGKVLEGAAAGTLTLTFSADASLVEFGVALNTIGNVTGGFSVQLFDPDLVSLGTTSVDTSNLITFSEGFFSSGESLVIGEVVVTFNSSFSQPIGGSHRFLLDNLTFEQATPIPEASTGVLLVLGVGGLAVYGRRRRRPES